MKILITGGAGFIASHLVDAYLKSGHRVVIVDDLSVGKKEQLHPDAQFYQVSVTDAAGLRTVFEKERPEVINHHAAQKFLRRSVEFPAEDAEINILGSINLMDLALKYGAKQFIFASTAAVYGDQLDQVPYQESFAGRPIAPYGVAKRSVEDYLYTYAVNNGLIATVLRYANVYGPRQDAHGESGVVAIFAEQLLAGQAPTIFGSGEQTRDYVFVGDVVRANLLVTERPVSDIVNISTMVETPLSAIYGHLARITGGPATPNFAPAKKGDPARVVLDNQKAHRLLGWQPETDLTQGLEQTVTWFKNQPRGN